MIRYIKTLLSSAASLQFAIFLLIIFTILTLLGLLIPQNQPIDTYKEVYGGFLFALLSFFSLFNLYHSPLYVTIVILIIISIVICTFKKTTLSLKGAGIFLTHISIALLFSGILIGVIWGKKGSVELSIGEEKNKFISRNNSVLNLPFIIRLDEFIVEKEPAPLSNLFVKKSKKDMHWKKYSINKGDMLSLSPLCSLQIEDIIYNKKVVKNIESVNFTNNPQDTVINSTNIPYPAVSFSLFYESEEYSSFLINKKGENYKFIDDKHFIRFVYCRSKKEYEDTLSLKDDFYKNFHSDILSSINTITIINAPSPLSPKILFTYTNGVENIESLILSKMYSVEGADFTLRIQQFFDKSILIERLIDDKDNCTVKLKITPSNEIIYLSNNETYKKDNLEFGFKSTFPISQYISKVTIIDGDMCLPKIIKMNSPLFYRGYTFYQSSYDTENFKTSGLLAARDPGVPVVYISLFLFLIGILTRFYIFPFYSNNREK